MNTKKRTDEVEIMDDFAMKGEILREALDKIAKINQLLGGNKLTLRGVQKLLKTVTRNQEVTIADIGCGNGDMIRKLADFGEVNNLNLKLIGIDANDFTVQYAQKLSLLYPNIRYIKLDIFDQKFENLKYDVALCTLTLHHFKDNEIEKLLSVFYKNAKIGIVVNDLHRSMVSYRLFQALCLVFNLNSMSKQDGLVSILRGFKKQELVNFSKKLQFKKYSIQWKWAFRYQWIIKKV